MTKRQAMIAATGAVVGMMSGSARSESGNSGISNWNSPHKVTIDLDGFESFVFTQGGRSVTVTPRELFEALSS